MKRLSQVFFILLTSVISAQEKPEKDVEIPFVLSPNGHIIIDAEINGVKGKFVFDTGAGINLMTQKFADTITRGLEKTKHFHTGHRATGEQITSDLWIVENLDIQNFEWSDELFAIYDFEFPLDGLISLRPFLNNPITIDFKKNVLIIESKLSMLERRKKADFILPIKISNDKERTIGISTVVQLNNKLSLLVNLDSGAGFDVYRFNSRYMTDLHIDSTTVKHSYIESEFVPEEGNNYYFTSIRDLRDGGENSIKKKPDVTFIDGLIYEGIMGVNWIGEILTIDLNKEEVLVIK